MRMKREFYKPHKEGVYIHAYNHTVTLEYGQLPLNNIEKENFKRILERYLLKYNIDVISLVLMGNHFHILMYCHAEKLTPEQAVKAYAKFHHSKKELEADDWRIGDLIKHSNNMSEFMREVQLSFSKWFNKSRAYKRNGALWQDRFQCQLIQSDVYLWSCLQYIEMNPVRAKICNDPADYHHSTFGRWSQTGRHPYKADFITHILKLADNEVKLTEFKSYMHSKMKLAILDDQWHEVDNEGTKKEISLAIDQELSTLQDLDLQVITFKKEDWRSQKVIGSEGFIREKYRQWDNLTSA
jgi:REP element-mobilizing transposase RayT